MKIAVWTLAKHQNDSEKTDAKLSLTLVSISLSAAEMDVLLHKEHKQVQENSARSRKRRVSISVADKLGIAKILVQHDTKNATIVWNGKTYADQASLAAGLRRFPLFFFLFTFSILFCLCSRPECSPYCVITMEKGNWQSSSCFWWLRGKKQRIAVENDENERSEFSFVIASLMYSAWHFCSFQGKLLPAIRSSLHGDSRSVFL